MNPLVEEAAATAHKLAILQAYPLGTLKVETPYGPGRLTGLRFDCSHNCTVADVRDIKLVDGGAVCALDAVKPYLKNFAALCTPLDDGTGRVPVIEMVKALTYYPDPSEDSEAAQPDWKLAHAYYEGGKIEVFWDEHEPGEDGESYTPANSQWMLTIGRATGIAKMARCPLAPQWLTGCVPITLPPQ